MIKSGDLEKLVADALGGAFINADGEDGIEPVIRLAGGFEHRCDSQAIAQRVDMRWFGDGAANLIGN